MQIAFAWRPSEKKGKLRGIDLALCFSLLLPSSDPDLITAIEMGCDFGEAAEKWELGFCLAFEGLSRREPQARPDLISSGKGRKTTEQNSCPDENVSERLHTTRPRVVGLPFLTGRARQGRDSHPAISAPGAVSTDPAGPGLLSFLLGNRPSTARSGSALCPGESEQVEAGPTLLRGAE